jgi:hypothetical protein
MTQISLIEQKINKVAKFESEIGSSSKLEGIITEAGCMITKKVW